MALKTFACAATRTSAARAALMALTAATTAPIGHAQTVAAADNPTVEVLGHYDNAIGTSDAASEGSVTQRLIANRPALRTGEILEFVPGMIVTQHSGDGKANQYFLRGFNLDHGTDFATFVDGMPINMVSHAHGQGYTDLNFLIPELVQRIDYRKGPYFAREGDFASAGSARIALADSLKSSLAELRIGDDGYRRGVFAGSTVLGQSGWSLVGGLEAQGNDGPWQVPEDLRKYAGVLRLAQHGGDTATSVTLMAYDAKWTSTDQIPARAVADGSLDRYGSLDPSDGGKTARYSLSAQTRRRDAGGEWQASAYAVQSRLNLYSNFTYLLDDPVNGDQFEQAEKRRLYGGELLRRFDFDAGGQAHVVTAGLQLRHDRLSPVGLYATAERQRLSTTQESQVEQTQVGLYADWATRWTPWLRSVAGVRADDAHFDVASSVPGNSGTASSRLYSPKLALVFGPWRNAEYFVNFGRGLHSNDARGTVAAVSPREGTPIDSVPGLVPSKGYEVGARAEWLPGLQTSVALWRLDLASELVFVGDAGDTEPNRASRRHGLELNNHWVLDAYGWKGWLADVDLAFSQARFRTDEEGIGTRVPGAVSRVASAGLTYAPDGSRWFGGVQMRYFGPRDLVEDGSQRSASTALAYLRAGYRPTPQLALTLDVFNLFDRQASDIDYYYASRLAGEPTGGVDDRHFHPVEPRSVRVSATYRF